MASNQQIISDLRLIMETNHDLDLLNMYKGVPFICKARIQSIDGDFVKVITSDPTIICIVKDGQTRVLGSDYFEPTIAKVESVDLATGEVVLNNFSYLGTKLGERMIVRVEPKEPIDIVLNNQGHEIVGQLVDLSISGIGVRLRESEYSPYLKPGTSLTVTMQLPGHSITLPGTVLSASKVDDFYRLSIRFGQNGPEKKIIFHYLIDRRSEIEEEIQRNYQEAIN